MTMGRGIRAFVLNCAAGALILPAPAMAGTDLYLVRTLDNLAIYDRYQQPLPDKDIRAIPKGAPLVIVDESGYLGDGFTAAIKVTFLERTLFIMVGENRTIARANLERVSGCVPMDDTLRCLAGNGIAVRCGFGGEKSLLAGDLVQRLFSVGGKVYGRTLEMGSNRSTCFGWLVLGTQGSWEVNKGVSETVIAPDTDLADRVSRSIKRANTTYQEFFREFDKATGKDIKAPHWEVEAGPDLIRCVLRGNPGIGGLLQRSTAELVKEIEHALADRVADVAVEHDDIVVRIGGGQE